MEERVIKLSLEKAKEFYKKGGELKDLALLAYTESELTPLPKTWEEYCKICNIESLYDKQQIKIFIPANKQFSDAHIALMKLHQLRDYYRKGWEPNWKDRESVKYAIIRQENLITTTSIFSVSSFLSFQTREIAEQFLKNFEDLIKQAGDLI